MTRCMKNKVNLKSSAYNQTGQGYFEQLTAYNSMSSHLRRVLLAKSVVDARNKNYISRKKNKRCKLDGKKKTYPRPIVSDDVIDKLAYDTQHHPMNVLRMNSKHLNCYDCNLGHRLSVCCDGACCKSNHETNRRQRSTSRNQRMKSPMTSHSPKRKRKCRHETDPLFVPCTTTNLDSSRFKSTTSRPPIQEMYDHRSASSSTSHSYDSDYDDKFVDKFPTKQLLLQREKEKKYVKFVYDITKEIMQSGLYTDKELQDVFKKHIDQNKGILNMNKMLYEIYQLKISLNVADDSDTDEELEDLIHAQKLLTVSEIRPPTPPKVLDENKVMEKLHSYQKLMENQRKSTSSTKSVVLVDANPELLVTERDVLISLMEVGIDPKQAQHICKNLLHRSRDTFLAETVQVGAETSYPSNSQNLEEIKEDLEEATENVEKTTQRLKIKLEENIEESRDDDKQASPITEAAESARSDSAEDYTADFSEKQEDSSSMANLESTQDETVETEEKTDSQEASDDRKSD